MPTIFTTDSLRAAVEGASGGRITVLYTASGQPTYMNIIPAFNLEDIDPSLGTGLHPAFTVGGVQQSQIFIGTYPGIIKNGELLSLPNVDPGSSFNCDQAVAYARAMGPGWHCMTNAEYAAIALWCWKNGFQPHGNDNYGASTDAPWETGVRQDGLAPGLVNTSAAARTLTGSGPASWRHDNTPAGISDLCGNVWEWSPGLRLNSGEIQVIQNNDAALAATDLSATSTAWQAIASADGSLVAPGTAGTLKYDASASNDTGTPILSTTITNPGDGTQNVETAFQSLTAASGLTVPSIAKALGVYPAAATGLGDDRLVVNNNGERLPLRGGSWFNGTSAGVFGVNLSDPRSNVSTSIGARPAFVI